MRFFASLLALILSPNVFALATNAFARLRPLNFCSNLTVTERCAIPIRATLPQGGEGESLAAARGEGFFRWNHQKTAFFRIYGQFSDFPVTFQSYGTSCHSLPMKRESFPMPRHSLPAASHRLPVTWESFLTRWDCLPSSWRRLPAAWEDYRTAWDSLPMAWNRLPAAWEDYRTARESNGASPADDETSRGSHCELSLKSESADARHPAPSCAAQKQQLHCRARPLDWLQLKETA